MDHARSRVPPLNALAADLHLHSTASDGTHPPSEVVRLASRVGLEVISLTDHDTVAGYADAARAGHELGVRVIPGAEFSVQAPWGEMHLLAYGIDPADPPLLDFMTRAISARRDRGVAIVAAVARLGVPLTFDDVVGAAKGAPIGRPHVARALIARGVTRSVDEGFDRFLGRGRVGYVPKRLPSIEETTALVRVAGGLTSAAHLRARATPESLETLKAQGVDAIEVKHPKHSAPAQRELERLARRIGLLATGGSDWHGDEGSAAHGAIGAERISAEWVAALDQLIDSRTNRAGRA